MIALLSEHFALEEFTRSQLASRAGRPIQAPPEIVAQLTRLARFTLEDVRELLGGPIVITSGYRPAWLNARVGGAPDSAHVFGRAADFHVPGMGVLEACRRIAARLPLLAIDQLIYEFGAWVHVGIAAPGVLPRREILTANFAGARALYTAGLPARPIGADAAAAA